eukprot:CAMPEP_0202362008 /NCGR_PEP_ID=MMETSP1126-20121109/14344_1 /ASSEMBLY_ACC=CAM_ASM_000457 /TAXON_ID=3047 /ORGANISM="Dunaliella tertiolecta, Strain CCMP1320" /LENGTH=57 /DNA_ID=CAMNT_0048956077 /DNA_START=319 /DNA_END=489 /DNA_ORIENTATION=+
MLAWGPQKTSTRAHREADMLLMMIEVKRALKDETRSACVPSRVHTCRSQSPRQSMPG